MKNLQNLGKALNKTEQKEINGGRGGKCSVIFFCPMGSNAANGSICFLNGGIEGSMLNGLCCA